MGVVLPGEPDAAVDLDALRGAAEEGLRAVRLRDGRRRRELRVVARVGHAGGVVRGRSRRLDRHEHVRKLVLDRLEGADRAAELHAGLGVFGGHLEAALGSAKRLGGERNGCPVQSSPDGTGVPHASARIEADVP